MWLRNLCLKGREPRRSTQEIYGMNPSNQEGKARRIWMLTLKRIASIRLNRFWEGVVVGVLGTVIGTVIVNAWFTPSSTEDIEKKHVEKLIASEAEFALARDLDKYRNLFAADAWVIEVRTQKVWAHQDQI